MASPKATVSVLAMVYKSLKCHCSLPNSGSQKALSQHLTFHIVDAPKVPEKQLGCVVVLTSTVVLSNAKESHCFTSNRRERSSQPATMPPAPTPGPASNS